MRLLNIENREGENFAGSTDALTIALDNFEKINTSHTCTITRRLCSIHELDCRNRIMGRGLIQQKEASK